MAANRWIDGDGPRGDDYDRRFVALAARGVHLHGEADLIEAYGAGSVLDAGCGTGRVAIELARRGHHVVGLDLDPSMLAAARRKAPELTWLQADLAVDLPLTERFEVVALAGNVLIFVTPGTEGAVMANLASCLVEGGRLIAGYSLRPGGFDVARHDALAEAVGLVREDRWSTWDRAPFTAGSDYTVSVHRRVA